MPKQTSFLRINFITLAAVYLLIVVGAVVRSLGAGMGCPDWPKCFGSYIPPTSIHQLPADYEEIFLKERLRKNDRMISLFERLGWNDLAARVASDPQVSKTEPFHAAKAWIEYVNRLVGVVIGLLIIANLWYAFRLRKNYRGIAPLGLLVLILVVFQGWVGSLVVSTNLLPGFITFHMLLALALVALLLIMRLKVQRPGQWIWSSKASSWIMLALVVGLIPQITLGTLTREEVDLLLKQGVDRSGIIAHLPATFLIHRSYSWLLVLLSLALVWQVRSSAYRHWGYAIFGLVVLEVFAGAGLNYLGMPVWIQPIHLLLATLLFGAVFYVFLYSHRQHATHH